MKSYKRTSWSHHGEYIKFKQVPDPNIIVTKKEIVKIVSEAVNKAKNYRMCR
tara:strand:- start:447 stop:602 length:156 start_codon:yes stop_codon:yes gene_type:complete